MADNLLISPDKVLNFTQLGPNFPEDDIRNAILYAQRTIIHNRIGRNLYDRLQSDITNNPTPLVAGSAFTGSYETLVDDYIQDLLLNLSFYELQAISFARPSSRGFVQPNSSPESTTASESIYRQKRKITEEKINFFDKRLIDYLIANMSSFAELSAAVTIESDRPNLVTSNSINPIHLSKKSAEEAFFDRYPGVSIYSSPNKRYN